MTTIYHWCATCHCSHMEGTVCPETGRMVEGHGVFHPSRLIADGPILPVPHHDLVLRHPAPEQTPEPTPEPAPLTGGSSDYYKLDIEHPTSGGIPYTAECNDIIEALDLNFAEGNVLKAVWRHALARQGKGKQGNTAKYDAEKIVFFGQRLVEQAS